MPVPSVAGTRVRSPTPPSHDASTRPSTAGTRSRLIEATTGSAVLAQVAATTIRPTARAVAPQRSTGRGIDRAPTRSRTMTAAAVATVAMTASQAKIRAITRLADRPAPARPWGPAAAGSATGLARVGRRGSLARRPRPTGAGACHHEAGRGCDGRGRGEGRRRLVVAPAPQPDDEHADGDEQQPEAAAVAEGPEERPVPGAPTMPVRVRMGTTSRRPAANGRFRAAPAATPAPASSPRGAARWRAGCRRRCRRRSARRPRRRAARG